ncbi:MAG: serine/threonine protein kinase [Planctomycetaceae bacterium]|nr:serine/threonine protein kinase [Planctomycetaceae bacterium]
MKIAVPATQLLVSLLLVFPYVLSAEDWPQFRGPNCSGISTASDALPVKFSATEKVRWTADLGDGIGCPVVADGRIFVSAVVENRKIGLYCFDSASGRRLWERTWDTGLLLEVHETNSHASTTPAADADRVYFYSSTLGMLALDARSGADVWRQKLPVPYFVFKWGAGISPVLYGDKLLFVQDDDIYPALYAFDKSTGKILWKDDRSDMAVNYSHPVICETAAGPELVVAGTGKLIGYNLQTGRRQWHARTLLRNIKTTPAVQDGVVYISLESGGIANQWLATADRSDTGNSDGKLSKEEMQAFVGEIKIPPAFFKKTFDRGDANKDGLLEGSELDRAFLPADNFAGAAFNDVNPSQRFIQAVRGGGKGDVTQSHVLWNIADRTPDHIVSPLVLENRMFVVKGGGISSCFNTADGEPFWHLRRIQNIGEYFASPICGDGKIYVAGENGTVIVLAAEEQLKVLAKNRLDDSIVATPAIADGRLLVRTRTKLICFGEK